MLHASIQKVNQINLPPDVPQPQKQHPELPPLLCQPPIPKPRGPPIPKPRGTEAESDSVVHVHNSRSQYADMHGLCIMYGIWRWA